MLKVILVNDDIGEEIIFTVVANDEKNIETKFIEIMGRGWEISSIENIRLIKSLGNDW